MLVLGEDRVMRTFHLKVPSGRPIVFLQPYARHEAQSLNWLRDRKKCTRSKCKKQKTNGDNHCRRGGRSGSRSSGSSSSSSSSSSSESSVHDHMYIDFQMQIRTYKNTASHVCVHMQRIYLSEAILASSFRPGSSGTERMRDCLECK